MAPKGFMRDEALALTEFGFAVFPTKPDKTPATKNGFKDATTDPVKVEAYFATNKNIGIATGPVSGFWTLDVEAEGLDDLARLEQQHGKLPETVVVTTGGGGKHFYFACNGREIHNTTRLLDLPIDVRGDGGYVVAPPSLHKSGKHYSWSRSPDNTRIAPAPDWLLNLVETKAAPPQPALSFTVGTGTAALDLATAPGAGEGQRHDMALKLIGSAVGRGLDSCEVARQAIDWGARCTPPLGSDEVLKIVGDLSRKQTIVVESERQAVEEVALPEPAPWPTLDEAALYGLAGDVVRAITPQTEADPVAILIQLLVFFGNLVGRAAHFVIEGTTHHANLFAVLVGATARGRKGTSEGRVRQLLRFADSEWEAENIASGLVSGEGLVYNVRDAVRKGDEEIDSGASDKRLLVVESEFASVLRVCRRETNTLSPTLRAAWDSGNMRTLAKNVPCRATNAHISLVGHITLEELRLALAEADGFNGFANRFWWCAVRRSKLLPDGGADLDLSDFALRLAHAAKAAELIQRMRRDTAAAKLWQEIYHDLANDNTGGLLGAATSRAEAQVLRASIVYALLDGSPTITAEHLAAARAVWNYCRQSARLIFGDASGNPLEDKVLATIRAHDQGVGRWELRSLTCKNKPAAVLVGILAKLRDANQIESRLVATAGRSVETWFALGGKVERVKRAVRVVAEPTPSTLNDLNTLPPSTNSERQGGLTTLNTLPPTSSIEESEWEEFTL